MQRRRRLPVLPLALRLRIRRQQALFAALAAALERSQLGGMRLLAKRAA
jgi:hypothetical protein